jgi:hypothetical protein
VPCKKRAFAPPARQFRIIAISFASEPEIAISIAPQKHKAHNKFPLHRKARGADETQWQVRHLFPGAERAYFKRLAISDCCDQPRASGDIERCAYRRAYTFSWHPLIG